MDDADFRLLALLHQDGLRSHAALGEALGTSAQAAAKRMRQLAARGVLRGFFALPEPEVFRRRGHVFPFHGGEWGEAGVRSALGVQDVVWVAEKHDGDLTVQVYADDPDASPLAALVRVLGAEPTGAYRAAPPQEWPVMSRPDWRVLDALLEDPRQPVARLAERCGCTVKAARRRRSRLVNEGLVSIRPLLGPAPGGAVLLFHVGVFSERPLRPREVQRALPGAVEVNRLDAPPVLYLFCRAPDLAGVFAARAALERVPGVREARLSLDRALHLNRALLTAWVARGAEPGQEAGAAGPASAA